MGYSPAHEEPFRYRKKYAGPPPKNPKRLHASGGSYFLLVTKRTLDKLEINPRTDLFLEIVDVEERLVAFQRVSPSPKSVE